MSSSALCNRGAHSDQEHLQSSVLCRRGVLLINLGTPDGPDIPSVRRYLAEFLGDPHVVHLPRGLKWMNGLLGRMIARLRASRSAEMYRRIWTDRGSPLGSITEEQAVLLEDALPDGWDVFYAMRYGRPTIAEKLGEIEAAGIDELVVIPMYPQFSGTTSGTALHALYGNLKRGNHRINVTTRNTWFDDGGYVHAQAKLIEEYAKRHGLKPENSYLVFSAHGLPVSYVERGDPYPSHVKRSVELVTQRLGWATDRMTLAYQSRLGPARWLRPGVDEMLDELARAGEKRVLICPISFTTDCLETLEEI
ncbi:MAG: ferrochelatase, partial [Phycisphaerales bacterium]